MVLFFHVRAHFGRYMWAFNIDFGNSVCIWLSNIGWEEVEPLLDVGFPDSYSVL